MNLRHGDDWDKMCSTTAATIFSVQFDHPTICVDEVRLKSLMDDYVHNGVAVQNRGRTGIWDVPDSSC